jgi:hypothetical protein
MGLLDDAIREHLELKRQHGADPTEIARQEREALGPPVRETHDVLATAPPGEAAAEAVPPPVEVAPPLAEEAVPPDAYVEPAQPEAPSSQPTAPFDAEQAFAEEDAVIPAERAGPPPAEPPPVEPEPPEPGPPPPSPESTEPPPEPPPEGEPSGEDVLEETPDFLQETPEHDRLWFEQKPPRDFDFDG